MKRNKKGFTLVELLVVVLIIGVLAAISLPMYQKAVKRSRFSALMPIAKALNEGNEHYYLNHSAYSTDPAELDIAGKDEYDDDTEVYLVDEDGFTYVMAYNENRLPDNKYIAFQKHSSRFANTTMCEAADEAAGQICESFGGTPLEGGLTSGWTAYLLSGDATGSNFCPVGATCNSEGEITECPSGKTLKEGSCGACDIENAATCSTTSYAAASCNEGYILNAGVCEVDRTPEKLQAVADTQCPTGQSQYTCTIKNGYVYKCDKTYGKVDATTGECVSNDTVQGWGGAQYETIYDADGNKVGFYQCSGVSSNRCYTMLNEIPSDEGTIQVQRECANQAAITKEGVCANGYTRGHDKILDSHGQSISSFVCSASLISTTTGQCDGYSSMSTYDNSYSVNGNRSYLWKSCTTVSADNPGTTCESSDYQPRGSVQYNEAGTAFKQINCSSGDWLNVDGTCPSGYIRSYDSATGQSTRCTNGVNWETATCK